MLEDLSSQGELPRANRTMEGKVMFSSAEAANYNQKVAYYRNKLSEKEIELQLNHPAVNMDDLAGVVTRQMLFSNFDKKSVPVSRRKLLDLIKAPLQGIRNLNILKSLKFGGARYGQI
eukprot:gene7153-261_t